MEYEEIEDHNYDSDFVDEDTEHRLYSIIFFGASSGNEPCSPNAAQDNNLFRDHVGSLPDYVPSNVGSQTPLTLSVNISSFRDEPCSDFEEFDLRDGSECVNISSTSDSSGDFDFYVEATSNDSTSSPFSSHHWTSSDVVLSVAGNSISTTCSPDDNSFITQQAGTSGSDTKLWRVDPEDTSLQRLKLHDSRYFRDTFNAVCSTCKKRGHFSFDCRSAGPTCIFCGDEGHTKNECKKLYCYVCLAPGHSKHTCTLRNHLKRSTCQRCGLQGHQSQLCTELWRQYKHTIKAGRPVRPPWTMSVSSNGCCNCGRLGHTVEECKRKRFRSNFIGPSPRRCVLVYDHKDIYRKLKSHTGNKRLTKNRLIEKKTARRGVVTDCGSKRHQMRGLPQNPCLTQQDVTEEMSETGQMERNITSSYVETTGIPTKTRRRRSTDGAMFISLGSTRPPSDARNEAKSKSGLQRRLRRRSRAAIHSPFFWINERMAVNAFNIDTISTPTTSAHLRGTQADHHNYTSVDEEHKVSVKSHGSQSSGTQKRAKKTKRTGPNFRKIAKKRPRMQSYVDFYSPEEQRDVSHSLEDISRLSSSASVISRQKVKGNTKEKKKKRRKECKMRTPNCAQFSSSAWLYHVTTPAKIESWDAPPTSTMKQELSLSNASSSSKRKGKLQKYKPGD